MGSDLSASVAADDYRPRSVDMGPEQWIDVDGIRTRYFDQGHGRPVVFFLGGHYGGADAGTARIWDLNFAALSKYLNVIAVDRLGQGFTDNPLRDEDYTMHASVQHAARFLRLLGKGPFNVVGHSRGGYLVTRLALENPDLVATATCVASGTLSPGFSRNHIVHAGMPMAPDRAMLRVSYERYSYDTRMVTEQLLDEPEQVLNLEKFKIAYRKMQVEGLETRYFGQGLRVQRAETHRWLVQRGMPCPTLLTWGLNDPTADIRNGKLLIEMFMRKQPKTELRVFNRAGHYLYREQPASFSRLLHSFVDTYG